MAESAENSESSENSEDSDSSQGRTIGGGSPGALLSFARGFRRFSGSRISDVQSGGEAVHRPDV